jgi:hypothetical protein
VTSSIPPPTRARHDLENSRARQDGHDLQLEPIEVPNRPFC